MGNERERGELILPRSARFADAATAFSRHHEGRSLTLDLWLKQFWRAATSVGANVEEGQSGQSRADFLHKMHVALKEARETRNWLRNALNGGLFPIAVSPRSARIKETTYGRAREVILCCLVDGLLGFTKRRDLLRKNWRAWAEKGSGGKLVESWLVTDAWLMYIEARQLVRIIGKIVGSTKRPRDEETDN